MMKSHVLLCISLCAIIQMRWVTAFSQFPASSSFIQSQYADNKRTAPFVHSRTITITTTIVLRASNNNEPAISISTPSSEAAAEMGIREWPQQFKPQGTCWNEETSGNALVRYVLDGTGSVEIVQQDSVIRKSLVQPGTLVEVTGDNLCLTWTADEDMIVLTPGFEQTGLLAGVALATVVILGGLLVSFGA